MDELMDDTHLCLACRSTIIGLDNYVIHKNSECSAKKQASAQSSKVGSQGANDPNILSSHQYHQQQTQGQTQQFGLQSSSTHGSGSGFMSLPTCQSGSMINQDSTLASTAHHNSTSYLHSSSHLPSLGGSTHSISNLIDDHSTTGPFAHSSSHHDLHDLSHSLSSDLASSSTQKLPAFRTFRSSSRLLPNLPREPSTEQIGTSDQSLHPLMPFSHHFNLNHRDHLNTPDHLDGHSASTLTPTSSNIGLSGVLTSPYTTAPHTQSANTAGLNVEVTDSAVVSFVNTLSPTSSRVVDPNMVLCDGLDKDTTFTDFFSSLELQLRVETNTKGPLGDGLHKTSPSNDTDHLKVGADGKLDIDHNKALHIANIINELAFSSDSDNILPSDAENLFDTSDEDSNEVEGMHPPPSHTGGKWMPGQKPATPKHDSSVIIPDKWNSSGKGLSMNRPISSPARSYGSPAAHKGHGGKIRAGLGKGKTMGGKWKAEAQKRMDQYDSEDAGEMSDDEQEPGEESERVTQVRGKHVSKGKVFPSGKFMPVDRTYFCKPCNRTLLNKVSYERHCSTTAHKKIVKKQDEQEEELVKEKEPEHEQKKVEVENIDCTVCNKTFNNRYVFARHLVSANHQRKALTDHKMMLLEEPYQLLLSRQSRFQCHICSFYCNTSEQLNVHVFSPAHNDMSSSLVGPQLCVRCKFACWSNAEMLDHIEGEQHLKTIEESDRPCVLRESRYRVQCRSCDKIFHSATWLKKHMEAIHGERADSTKQRRKRQRGKGPPICSYCQKKWPSFAAMELHIRRKHTLEKPFRCEDCDKGFADAQSLKIHNSSKKHVEKLVEYGDVRPNVIPLKKLKSSPTKVTHKCKLCDYVAEKYTDLRPHFLQNHLDSVLECTTCGVKFVSEAAFQKHLGSQIHQKTEQEARHSTATFTCNVCGRKFYHSKKFVLHKIVHRNVQNEKESVRKVCMSDTGINEKYREFLTSIQEFKATRKVECPVCHRNITKLQIYTHLRIHENVTPFGCIFCVQCFSCPKSLQRHLGGHLGLKCHSCTRCDKKFSRERLLAVHTRTEHSGDKKSFQCIKCNSAFSHKWRLRVHMLSHDKPVPCKEAGCKMRFKSKSAMLTHHQTHTGAKPFLCDQCGYAGATRQHLNRHRRTHSGERQYQCEYCEYRAINSTNLNRHMRIHIGTKPFKCPYCQFTCNSMDNVRKHIMKTQKHAGKFVYVCKACDSCSTNNALEFKQHLIRVHNVSEQNINVLSEYAGLYNKVEDVKTLPEGARAIQVRDRRRTENGENCKKRRKKSSNDHEYSSSQVARPRKSSKHK